jgi:hypothetical protein
MRAHTHTHTHTHTYTHTNIYIYIYHLFFPLRRRKLKITQASFISYLKLSKNFQVSVTDEKFKQVLSNETNISESGSGGY